MVNELNENEKIEIDLLLKAIHLKYGYDFRSYAKASIRRRIIHHLSKTNLNTISEMQHKLLNDEEYFERLLLGLTVNVTEMFRDPNFFKTLRRNVVPELKKQSHVKIWLAGCSSGEEVYSIAILLKEEGLVNNVQIYATDANEEILKGAKKGVFPISKMKDYTRNYRNAGGLASFANYYTADYDYAIMNNSLKKNIVFSDHNLVTDSVFGEMNLVLCRNVLIYFNRKLQDRAFRLFWKSLHPGGFLCLGPKETVQFSQYADDFKNVSNGEKIYRKKD